MKLKVQDKILKKKLKVILNTQEKSVLIVLIIVKNVMLKTKNVKLVSQVILSSMNYVTKINVKLLKKIVKLVMPINKIVQNVKPINITLKKVNVNHVQIFMNNVIPVQMMENVFVKKLSYSMMPKKNVKKIVNQEKDIIV